MQAGLVKMKTKENTRRGRQRPIPLRSSKKGRSEKNTEGGAWKSGGAEHRKNPTKKGTKDEWKHEANRHYERPKVGPFWETQEGIERKVLGRKEAKRRARKLNSGSRV